MASTASIVARGALGLRKEASFGSGGGIDNWQPIESASFIKTNQYVYQGRVRNTPEQVGGRFSNTMTTGHVVFPVSPANPSQWWVAGIGGSGPYTPQLPLTSLAIEIQEGDQAAVYSSGDMISSMELSSKQGDILRCTVNLECKDMNAQAVPSTVSFPSGDDPFLHAEATFTLDGVVNQQVTSFTVTKQNHLQVDLFANNRTRRDIPASSALVTGAISLLFENTTMRNRFLNQLPSSIVVAYSRGAKSFTVALNKVNYDSADRPLQSQAAYIIETLNFTAFVDDPTAENSLKITVV